MLFFLLRLFMRKNHVTYFKKPIKPSPWILDRTTNTYKYSVSLLQDKIQTYVLNLRNVLDFLSRNDACPVCKSTVKWPKWCKNPLEFDQWFCLDFLSRNDAKQYSEIRTNYTKHKGAEKFFDIIWLIWYECILVKIEWMFKCSDWQM